jgi:hypothetical protein
MDLYVEKWSQKEFKINVALAVISMILGIVLASIGGSSESIQEDYALCMVNGGKMLMFVGPAWIGIAAAKWFTQ